MDLKLWHPPLRIASGHPKKSVVDADIQQGKISKLYQ